MPFDIFGFKNVTKVDCEFWRVGLRIFWSVIWGKEGNGEGRNRTADAGIFSPSLYRLSYLAIGPALFFLRAAISIFLASAKVNAFGIKRHALTEGARRATFNRT